MTRFQSPRTYITLAFLPILIALATLVALYTYHRGEAERRDDWQKPESILDALDIRPAMRVAQFSPSDAYFLGKMRDRVGPDGEVYAVDPRIDAAKSIRTELGDVEIVDAPADWLDRVLLVLARAEDQDVAHLDFSLETSFAHLGPRGRLAIIGVGSEHVRGFLTSEDVTRHAREAGFELIRREKFLEPQFFLVFEKPPPDASEHRGAMIP